MKTFIFIIALITLASAQSLSPLGFVEGILKNSKEQALELFEKIIQQGNQCEILTAASCVGDLKGLFADCTSAICKQIDFQSSSGANVVSDFLCVKSLWSINSSQVKKCYGCICDFASFSNFHLPACSSNKKLLQSGINVFEELLQNKN